MSLSEAIATEHLLRRLAEGPADGEGTPSLGAKLSKEPPLVSELQRHARAEPHLKAEHDSKYDTGLTKCNKGQGRLIHFTWKRNRLICFLSK